MSMVIGYHRYYVLCNGKRVDDLPQVTNKLYHIILYRVHLAMSGIRTHNVVVIGTDCTGSKFNYHTITTTMAGIRRSLKILKM